MEIKYFCSIWGMEHIPKEKVFCRIRDAGFDGVEMGIPLDDKERDQVSRLLNEHDLLLVAQQYESTGNTFELYKEDYQRYLFNAASLRPLFINSQTGRDYFSFDENISLIKMADEIARQTQVKIVHETHRGKFAFSPYIALSYFRALRDLRIAADFSHWCNVSESLLQDQKKNVNYAIERVDHIHARIGHSQAAQVTDPRAPEWKSALDAHLEWWDKIVDVHQKKKTEILTITPEFGPYPYMQSLPYTQCPVANQWEINMFMKEFLAKRYGRK